VAAAFLACFLLAFSGTLFTGTLHPTMAVNVHEGPARQAGVQDGDRIVAIDGKHCPTFDVLRDELRTGSGPRNITFDRKGERITLVVAPTAEGRIGVEQRAERRRSTASEAIRWGFRMTTVPFRYLSQAFSVVSGSERPTLSGPVGIVKETSRQKSTDFGAVLGMAALLASFVWPVLVVVHGLDAFLSSRGRRAGGDQ
jgi:regulator of sigma E protease